MTPEQRKEELSKAYLHAIAARCGFAIGNWSQDHGGVDVTIGAGKALGYGRLSRPKIDIQLKCTSRLDIQKGDYIVWSLDRTHYDTLRAEALQPHLLVVLVLPEQEDAWLEHTVDALILRRCAFYVKMTGLPYKDSDTVTVRIPRSNVFSPEQLLVLMTRISEEGCL